MEITAACSATQSAPPLSSPHTPPLVTQTWQVPASTNNVAPPRTFVPVPSLTSNTDQETRDTFPLTLLLLLTLSLFILIAFWEFHFKRTQSLLIHS